MSDTARESAISKIIKLRQMTTANGCTEAEATRALELIAKLMAEHDIGQNEATIRAEAGHCQQDGILYSDPSDWTACNRGIETLFHVKFWKSTTTLSVLGLSKEFNKLNCFGFPTDVAAAMAMSDICHSAVLSEGLTWAKINGRRNLPSFRAGMAYRLMERIFELCPQEPQGSTGNALMVLKGQLVTEEFAKLNLNLRPHIRSVTNAAAFAAGASAGNKVRLGTHAEIPQQRLMIGRS